MKRFLFFIYFLSSCLVLFIQPVSAGAKIRVAATIFPLADMARNVGGDEVDVTLLLPPGATPHSWEPKPSDIALLEKVDIILMVGKELEPWASDVMGVLDNKNKVLIEACAGAHLMHTDHLPSQEKHYHAHHHHGYSDVDPHVWLDFSWDKTVVQRIVEALSKLEPEKGPIFKKAGEKYIRELEELDDAYKRTFSHCRTKIFIVGGHSAFGYLARAYGLTQISLYGISPDSRPTAQKMAHLISIIRENNINTIFFERSVSDRIAQTLALETGASIAVISTGANLSKEEISEGKSFIDLMYRNLSLLGDGLGCTVQAQNPPKD